MAEYSKSPFQRSPVRRVRELFSHDPFSALSHLVGMGCSCIGLLVLIDLAESHQTALLASAVYGASSILLYLASTITHTIQAPPRIVAKVEQYDHAAIYLFIAGTYTPVCLLLIPGPVGWSLLIAEWLLTVAGIVIALLGREIPNVMRVSIYLLMGWLFLLGLGPIGSAVSTTVLCWLFAGGLFYSIGTVFFITNRPVLWRGTIDGHDIWHLCVLGGSGCHFIFISHAVMMITA